MTDTHDDAAEKVARVYEGLRYIAASPPEALGGFHANAVQTAKDALDTLDTLRRERDEARRTADLMHEAVEKLTSWDNEQGKRALLRDAGYSRMALAAAQAQLKRTRDALEDTLGLTDEATACLNSDCGHRTCNERRAIMASARALLSEPAGEDAALRFAVFGKGFSGEYDTLKEAAEVARANGGGAIYARVLGTAPEGRET